MSKNKPKEMKKIKADCTLLNFNFKRLKTSNSEETENIDASTSFHNEVNENEPTIHPGPSAADKSKDEYVKFNDICEVNTCDVGAYLNKTIDDKIKYKLLSSPWFPKEDFRFPVLTSRKLKFQKNWFKRFPWLVYTQVLEQGALCRYCSIFQQECAGKGEHQKLGNLVTKPFNKWKDAIENFQNHAGSQYHQSNTLYAENFLKTWSKNSDIRMQLDSARANQISENRKKLIPIIETIIFCGRQELPLRGSSDSGPLVIGKQEPEINDGNFRSLLRMRISCGDISLKDHCEKSQLNAMYISPHIQNNIIKICGKIIQENLVQKINKSKCFSILVDETSDISRKEQLSLCVRYIDDRHDASLSIREDFLEFIEVKEMTGKNLANIILESLKFLGIDDKYLFGQGYDGAAAMSGSFKGVQGIIKKTHPAAIYVHCSAHSLNLALAHSCEVQEIRNCIGTIKAIGNFIKFSSKRTSILKNKIKEHFPNTKWEKLTSMCETRWVENHDGLLRFKEIYIAIVETLEELECESDIDTSSKASQFSKSIITSQFAISLTIASNLFSYTLPLCKTLQSPSCDLTAALEHIDNVANTLQHMRNNMDETFSVIFKKAENMLKSIGEEIKIPRIVSRQKNRINIDASTPEQYFRAAIAIPIFDDFLGQLQTRFTNHKSCLSSLHKLLPKKCTTEMFDKGDFEIYSEFLDEDTFLPELNLWKIKWSKLNENERPSETIDALSQCQEEFFPNVYFLLKVLVTLPVSTCTPERTFSSLRRLKSYLRNSTGQERLTGLALMSIHRDIYINPEDVINKFSAEKDRRLEFVL